MTRRSAAWRRNSSWVRTGLGDGMPDGLGAAAGATGADAASGAGAGAGLGDGTGAGVGAVAAQLASAGAISQRAARNRRSVGVTAASSLDLIGCRAHLAPASCQCRAR